MKNKYTKNLLTTTSILASIMCGASYKSFASAIPTANIILTAQAIAVSQNPGGHNTGAIPTATIVNLDHTHTPVAQANTNNPLIATVLGVAGTYGQDPTTGAFLPEAEVINTERPAPQADEPLRLGPYNSRVIRDTWTPANVAAQAPQNNTNAGGTWEDFMREIFARTRAANANNRGSYHSTYRSWTHETHGEDYFNNYYTQNNEWANMFCNNQAEAKKFSARSHAAGRAFNDFMHGASNVLEARSVSVASGSEEYKDKIWVKGFGGIGTYTGLQKANN